MIEPLPPPDNELFPIFIFVVLALSFYFLPTIIAVRRKKKNTGSIAVVNLFLGVTALGWVIALAWSLSHEQVDKADDEQQQQMQ